MSLLVDLQLVPNRILEVVKARILANRAKLTTKQQQVALVKAATRPRPQQQKLNATAVSYRRPEPSAQNGGVVQLAAGWLQEDEKQNQERVFKAWSRDGTQSLLIDTIAPTPPLFYELLEETGDEYNGARRFRRDVIVESRGGSSSEVFALPLSGDSMILVYVRAASQAAVKYTQEVYREWENKISPLGMASITIDSVYSQVSPPVEIPATTKYVCKCALVTQSSVREIAAPQLLQQKLRQFVYPYNEITYTSQVNAPYEFIRSLNSPGIIGLPPEVEAMPISIDEPAAQVGYGGQLAVSGTSRTFTQRSRYVESSINAMYASARIDDQRPGGSFYFYYDDSLAKLHSLGVPLNDVGGYYLFAEQGTGVVESGLSSFFSAGCYYAIQNPQTTFPADKKGAAIASEIFQGNAPRYSAIARYELLQAIPGGLDKGLVAPHRAQGVFHSEEQGEFIPNPDQPAARRTVIAGRKFSFSPPPREGIRANNHLYMTWNWNKPGYCRQQLKQLGFTDELLDGTDLQPPSE